MLSVPQTDVLTANTITTICVHYFHVFIGNEHSLIMNKVPSERLELSNLSALDPKSSVSTNSTN